MLESSHGSQQSGIQSVINTDLTLTQWDRRTPITEHRDHMKALFTHLKAVGLTISPIQFYQHLVNSLPADYDNIMVIHDPISSIDSIDVLSDHIRAVKHQKEIHTTSAKFFLA